MNRSISTATGVLTLVALASCGSPKPPTPSPSASFTAPPPPVAVNTSTPTPTPTSTLPIPEGGVPTVNPLASPPPGLVPPPRQNPLSSLPSPSLAPLPIPGGDRPLTTPPVRSPATPKPSPVPPPIANRDPKVNSQVAAIVQNSQILPNGIGTARIGMTLGELRRQIGDRAQFQKIQEFIPDHNAIAVRQGGQVQYYIVYERYSDFGDNDKIQYLITDNRNYRTEQGVGPGSSISDAEKTYGRPTLSYSRENESRETVRFPQTPSLTFLPAGSRGFAGIYPPANATEYQQTNRYQPQATISRVIVTCPEENCN